MKKSFALFMCVMFSCIYAFTQTWETNNRQFFERLADSLLNNNQKVAAISHYKKALSIFPNSWKSYSSLRNHGSEVHSDTIAVWLKKIIPSDIDYLPNIVFEKGGNRNLRLSILRPRGMKNKNLPVIIYLHGGGWQQNIKELGIVPLVQFVRRGYTGVAVEYRLSKEARFPSQIEDVKCAIRFLRAHAKQFFIDSGNIGVFGESAGGHLAALAGTSGGIRSLEGKGGWEKFSSSVQAVCEWSGPTYFPPDTTTNNAVYNLLGGTTLAKADLAKKASPLMYITIDDPPFLIFHGTSDLVVKMEHSDTLYKALRKANVDATLRLFEGGGHFAVYGASVGDISGVCPIFEMK